MGIDGLVTFLRTDIEGSSRLYQSSPEAMYAAVDIHDAVLIDGIVGHEGVIDGNEGDSFFAAFARPTQAVAAAVAVQCRLEAQRWPGGLRPRVRMGIHTGEAGRRSPRWGIDTRGLHANICGRLSDMACGGQILLTQYTAMFVRRELPNGVTLRACGLRVLRDIAEPQHVYELIRDVPDGLPDRAAGRRRLAVTTARSALRSSRRGRPRAAAGPVRHSRLIDRAGRPGVAEVSEGGLS